MEEDKTKMKMLGASVATVEACTGMFVGDTSNPNHLGHEVLDNALDEIHNSYADTIHVSIEDDGSFWVSDNGRGIETGIIKDEDTGKLWDTVVAACTMLFTGSKFHIEGMDDYDSAFGQNGVGLVVVNGLSDWLIVRTRDRNDRKLVHNYRFSGKEYIKEDEPDNEDDFSTIVGFKPKVDRFDSTQFDIETFRERLLLARCKLPGKYFLNGEEVPKMSIEEYARVKLNLQDETPLWKMSYTSPEDETITICATYLESYQKDVVGDVNIRLCEGSYLAAFQTALIKSLMANTFKKTKVAQDLLLGLRAFVSIHLKKPKFDAQTKTRMLTNIRKTLIEPMVDKIDLFSGDKYVIDTITTNLEKKYGSKKKRTSKKDISAGNKLRDCINSPGKVLYLLEGDSADGTLKVVRDERWEASLPLRGKVINVLKNNVEAVYKNEEVKNIREALGEEGNRRYEEVKILADADQDGNHIIALLILILKKFAKDMIIEGRVSIILPPLYGATKKNNYVPIYDQKDIEDFKKRGYVITRFKGLGEMDPDELKAAIRSGVEYKITWPKSEEIVMALEEFVLSPELKKRVMNAKHINMRSILDKAILASDLKNVS